MLPCGSVVVETTIFGFDGHPRHNGTHGAFTEPHTGHCQPVCAGAGGRT